MKKLLLCLLALTVVLSFAACAAAPADGTQSTQGGNTRPENPDGLYFTYNGTKIQLHAEAAPILAALGAAKSCTEEPSCAFDDGMDKTYTYDSFILTTYPLDGKDYVYSFWFVDDLVKTDAGIKIGDTEDAVKAAYPDAAYNGKNAYTVTKGDTQMSVVLKDGAVSSIQFTVVLG